MPVKLMTWLRNGYFALIITFFSMGSFPVVSLASNVLDYQAVPPFVTAGVPPLVMLVMGRNHKLYYEAYNDASDLNNDGILDVGYNPDIEYYGYFDSYKYYEYSSTNSRFEPKGVALDKKAPSGNFWSGDFLNYMTMTRMDSMRKVLYGGLRSTDTSTETVLERSFVPQDAHSWGKEYKSIIYDGYDIQNYTPLDQPKGGSRHLFASTTLLDGGDPLFRVLEDSVFRIWEWVAIERPVAGSEGNDGSGRRTITDNNVTGGIVDVTVGGTTGVADDSYSGGGGSSIIKADDFNDGSLDNDWKWQDHDNDGGTAYSESGGELILDAGGSDIWGSNDEFAVVYLEDISGDFDFKLKITQQERKDGWGKTGIMVRNDMTQAGSSNGYSVMSITPDNGYSFQWDNDGNGELESHSSGSGPASPPVWVRMTRQGNLYTGYFGPDGTSWTSRGSSTLNSANATQDVGIFVTSHNNGNLSECKFDEMELASLITIPDPDLAFDDDNNTTWTFPDEPTGINPVWIEFAFSTDTEIKSYSINAENDAPDDWTFEGSNDQAIWDVLNTVSTAGLTPGTSATFDCDSSAVYKYYRIVITDSSVSGTNGVSITEIQLMEDTEPIPANATLTDYDARVKVCDPAVGLEPNSKLYSSGVYKPTGILQKHGESDRMYFGLLTGSYTKNTSGGVLRKNIRSIRDEINSTTGEFLYMDSSVEGIIKTIDLFRIVDFDYGTHSYESDCGWITGRALNEGECRMWGNPVAEMMYESLRYFAGTKSPTAEFTYDDTASHDDNELGFPKPGWLDPYTNSEDINLNGILDVGEDLNSNGILDGFNYCAKPFMLVLSDINPTYDSDQLPGSNFPEAITSSLTDLNVTVLANTISTQEGDITTHFIGESATDDGACTPKAIPGFGSIRGLCPEEPTKGGSYYSGSVAYHGNKEDIHSTAAQSQNVTTYSVGLASPLPRIEILVGTNVVTLVPFAKSVGGSGISATQGDFQPTNTIVDFFVEEISPTMGKFRINYEDVEQGADHDMDAIVEYEYQVLDADDNPVADPALGIKVEMSLNSTYAAGGIIQHMGYIISGTTNDGTFLEVRDIDTAAGSDPDYFLDTPPGIDPGGAWNDSTALPLTSTRTFLPGTSTAATLLKNPLWYAAKWGGFEDYNGNNLPDLNNEWDKDNDGIPDTYFYVQNPLILEEQLNKSFADILRRTASGTAASVISHTRSGEGAVYQAMFYPELKGPLGSTVNWVGELHSLFVDSRGNMREDTDSDNQLDVDPTLGNTDRIIVFDGTIVYKYEDGDGNSIIPEGATAEFTGGIDDINYLWSSSSFLNEMTDADAASQRIYNTTTNNRYIFTFVDADNDMVADSGEQVDFSSESLPLAAKLTDTSEIFPYINLFPTFEDEPTISVDGTSIPIDTFRGNTPQFEDFLINQSSRVVNYIRGIDQGEFVSSTTPSYIIPEFRSRAVDYDEDGNIETWRLGDIVYSTPTDVGRPAENYHLLYRDTSYAEFAYKFRDRRHVIYAGANDGMFHAFNAGFFNDENNSFVRYIDYNTDGVPDAGEGINFELGAELWAYVPHNLLPHLYWLTEPSYPHVYYSDAKPKVFDAKVFADNTHYNAGGDLNWGTILVAGMRFGGGQIKADMDKTDGNTANANDRTMSSAFFILDVTNPEEAPKVIAEIKFQELGYTTCYPVVIPMNDKDVLGDGSIDANEWYLVFGSGPASATGSADINGSSGALSEATSDQSAKLYIVDLKELVLNGTLKTLDNSGIFTTTLDHYQALDTDSFISDPISVDFNLDYNTDAVYFGTVKGDRISGWGGKMRRIVINNDTAYANWVGDSILMDLDSVFSIPTKGQPVTTSPAAAIEKSGARWIYWGTGRFFVRTDSADIDHQSYYGIKEPFKFYDQTTGTIYDYDKTNTEKFEYGNGDYITEWTWDTVTKSDIINTSTAVIYDDKRVENIKDLSNVDIVTWDLLIEEIDTKAKGWYLDFSTSKERNLGQAALLGELLTFTTYIPSDDICSFEGQSNLYGSYFKTGTAFYKSIIGTIHHDVTVDYDGEGQLIIESGELEIKRSVSLGQGLAVTPNIHVGKEEGSKAFVQTSTGAIEVVDQINPGATKSGVTAWQEQ
ncbi:MAG: hypothetical protein GY808_14110 [Gammaproteobacteria bacterium]|nr:hypothetical protein [Gammaproteobacteria bacterium]